MLQGLLDGQRYQTKGNIDLAERSTRHPGKTARARVAKGVFPTQIHSFQPENSRNQYRVDAITMILLHSSS